MKLENMNFYEDEARNAIEILPEGVVNKEICGRVDFHKPNRTMKNNPYVQLWILDGLCSLEAPEGATDFKAVFGKPRYASFIYKGIGYIFLDHNSDNDPKKS